LIAGGPSALVFSGIEKTLLFIPVSPGLGFGCAFGVAIAVMYFSETKQHPVLTGFSVDFKFFLQSSFH
jgi:hypothetical protein